MSIWSRLGNVIRSYVNNDVAGKSSNRSRDPDLDAAYEELDDYLNGNSGKGSSKTTTWKKPVPEDIKQAFRELGLTLEATAEECKEAYKKLLKTHHPDRHAKNEENLKTATEKTSRVNAAYERLIKWFKE